MLLLTVIIMIHALICVHQRQSCSFDREKIASNPGPTQLSMHVRFSVCNIEKLEVAWDEATRKSLDKEYSHMHICIIQSQQDNDCSEYSVLQHSVQCTKSTTKLEVNSKVNLRAKFFAQTCIA